jgi:hypothetical protein
MIFPDEMPLKFGNLKSPGYTSKIESIKKAGSWPAFLMDLISRFYGRFKKLSKGLL